MVDKHLSGDPPKPDVPTPHDPQRPEPVVPPARDPVDPPLEEPTRPDIPEIRDPPAPDLKDPDPAMKRARSELPADPRDPEGDGLRPAELNAGNDQ